ncbi:hypothetical protein NM688_g3184 [Phlebia brevispora]|uniref:Uncharacterized protein n=1 Tax=Phlebia brevispora TaxID=194682 RepID=A0ACC1T6D8_9APHY|nr:hypothetical protein NM688_g3184 [Phlebia brevispora]
MATSCSLAETFAKLIPYFNMFVDIDKYKLIETFDIVESKSPVFKKIMTADHPIFKKAEHKEDDSGDLKTEIAGIREALKGFALDIDSKEDMWEGLQNLSVNVSSLLYLH